MVNFWHFCLVPPSVFIWLLASSNLPAEGLFAHGNGDGQTGVDDLLAAHETLCAVHGNGANLHGIIQTVNYSSEIDLSHTPGF